MNQTVPATTSVSEALLLSKDDAAEEPAADSALQKLHQKIQTEVSTVKWGLLRRRLLTRLAEEFKDPVVDCVIGAWKTADELLEYGEQTKGKSGPPRELVLGEHTIKTAYEPQVTVFLGRQKIGTLRVSITLALKIQGLVLLIQNGNIVGLKGGTCQPSGKIAVEGQTVYEKKTDPVSILLDWVPPEGIAIVGRGER